MIKLLASLLLVMALVFSTLPATAASKPITDDALNDQVKIRLAGDVDVKGGALDIEVKQGVVTLRGEIDSEKKKDKATRLTKKVHGVKGVDNQLKVVPR